MFAGGCYFFLPKMREVMAPPILRSTPARVVGMPVALDILRFAAVMPTARLSEKLRPGIFVFDMMLNFK